MKMKAILTTLIVGAVSASGLMAGEWCPPDKGGKCPVECCPDLGASVAVGYDSDYVWRGVRLARDMAWLDVNYTLQDVLPVALTLGVWHGSSLSSIVPGVTDNFGDKTELYARAALPEIMGFTAALDYTLHLFPGQRPPAGVPGPLFGDSFHQVGLSVSREIMSGIMLNAGTQYFFGNDINGVPADGDLSAWYRYAELGYTYDISDSIALALSAGVAMSDGLWNELSTGNTAPGVFRGHGFNHYYARAALPIALNCRTTLSPYVAYSGTPDTWVGDGVGLNPNPAGNGVFVPGANQNDLLYWGVSLRVNF